MTTLTREQELALIEALGNGGEFTRTDIKEPIGWARGIVWCDVAIGGCELTPEGVRLATALKSRDESRIQHSLLRARIKEIQRAMHSAGYKSAAAMLNPILRGESE